MARIESKSTGEAKTFLAICPSSLEITDWVYISGNKVGSYFQVNRANPLDASKIPAMGVIIGKNSDTEAIVQYDGKLSGLISGLNSRLIFYLGSDGKATQTIPTTPSYIQPLGVAVNSDEILINPDWPELPEITYVSHFNTNDSIGDCRISNVGTSNRYVSAPVGHFDIGDWTPGTIYGCLRNSSISYNTNVKCSFLSGSSLVAQLLGADGTTVIAENSVTVTGNVSFLANGITIAVSGWEADYNKFKGLVTIQFNLSSILTTGGRFSIRMIHNNGDDGIFTKVQSSIFYDKETNAAVANDLSIAETSGFVVTRFLSGVEYYTIGSRFTVDIADIDWLNDESYPLIQVQLNGNNYGLNQLNLGGSDLGAWGNQWNNVDAYYHNAVWAISQIDLTIRTITAIVWAMIIDWDSIGPLNSPQSAILIETHDDTNTRTTERYYLEDWRCALLANFDLPNARLWDSEIHLNSDDALFYGGGCEHNDDDWSLYNPNSGSQPDYSLHNSRQYFIREFKHDGSASSGFTLNISGSFASMEYKLAKAWDGTPSGGTNWVNALADYNAALWNNGNPSGGSGGRTETGHYTFGTNNIINCSDTVYVKIGFDNANRITGPTTVIFD